MQHPHLCTTLWLLAATMFFAVPATAAECSVSSGAQTVALLELYTSEGCSSCPPADRWLSSLSSQGYASDRVIPLALHVDYWDYIGWQDRFAKPGFTARQRMLAGLNSAGFVYTPQVMLNGRDNRKWRNAARFEEDIRAINRGAAHASIKLALKLSGTESLEISAAAQAAKPDAPALYVALYENDLHTAVRAGENSGATLHHDYVVREWLGPFPIDDKLVTPWALKIRLKPEWKTASMGIVAFVQNRETGEILQATTLKLCS